MKLARALLLSLVLATVARAQPTTTTRPVVTTMFPHPEDTPFLVTGQMNLITQYHPTFRAPYSGPKSLSPQAEAATSFVATLYTAFPLARWTEGVVNVEMAAGGGIGQALGLAGFTNLDVVRNPTLGAEPYVARLILRQIIPLTQERVDTTRTPLGLATRLPTRRLELHVGRLSTVDFFDVNAVGSDSHLQFMNWTVDNNGGYDYAADTRGYTWGVVVEYIQPAFAVRFGEMLMPKEANGLTLDFDVSRARAANLEVEFHHELLPGRVGIVRLLGYLNHANMGSYREAIDAFLAGEDPVPDIEAHRRQGRKKYGFGLNLEQEVVGPVRAFARVGWNEGTNESFAFTEVNNTVALGGDVRGTPWSRPLDKVGLAVVSNGLSSLHSEYLALGGQGFLLGDGRLNYGRENILEAYYNAHLWRGLYAALDYQHVTHPGYNRDRGPVHVGSLRLHLDL